MLGIDSSRQIKEIKSIAIVNHFLNFRNFRVVWLFAGNWVETRRKSIDLTLSQEASNSAAPGCSPATIAQNPGQIERRPSRQIAELLAPVLAIPAEQARTDLKVARGEKSSKALEGHGNTRYRAVFAF
jgi:hypothetical protein